MSAGVRYTLGRIGLFLAAFLVLYPVPRLSVLMKMLVALLVSFALSWFLLRPLRDRFAEELADRVERRRADKERLRAALAGEDEPGLPVPDPARAGPPAAPTTGATGPAAEPR